jgi:hypothetical protein
MPFKALGLHPSLVRAAKDLGYAEPTPVQAGAGAILRRSWYMVTGRRRPVIGSWAVVAAYQFPGVPMTCQV